MRFSICLPATRQDTVGATIASIRRQTLEDWELIVVTQGGADHVRAAAERSSAGDARVRYIHVAKRGASAARNAAMLASAGEVIAMLDDDCEAEPDWLLVIADCLDSEPDVGLVGGALVAPPPARRGPGNCPSSIPADVVYDPVRDGRKAPAGWDWLSANLAFRRENLDRVGLFDEHLGPGTGFPSCDDTDYKLRFESAGVRMRSTPQAVVHHTGGWRYGLRPALRHQKNYARGNGAMAGKLTLMRDPRGEAWLRAMREDCLGRWYHRRQPLQLPAGVRRWRHFNAAYHECLDGYRVDGRGLLTPASDIPEAPTGRAATSH